MDIRPRALLSFLNIRRTLQINILIAFAMLLIITVVIIVSYTYHQNSASLLHLSDDLVDQVSETLIGRTTNYLAPAAIMAQISADIPTIESLSLVDNAELEQYGMSILEQYPQLAGFFIGNEQGEFLFTKRFPDGSIGTQIIDRSLDPPTRTWIYRDVEGGVTETEVTTDFEYDPRQRPWYLGAAETRQQYWTDIYIFFTDQKPGITAAYPLTDEQGQLVGVVGIDVALDQMSQFLQTQRIGQNGVAFIINDKGEVVAYPNVELATAEGEGYRPLKVADLEVPAVTTGFEEFQRQPQARFTFESGEQRFIASFTPFPATFDKDWQIGVIVPEDDFIGSLKQTNQITLLISLGILLAAIVLAIFISRAISQPIELLTVETRKIKDFELDSDLEIHSPIHEVQLLGDSIISMRSSLQTFKKYVPAELVRQVIQTGEVARLGGQKKELTVFFSDVADFTTISEKMAPETLMLQLSDYLGTLATAIDGEQGTVDKYMGDGLMAFWGAPLPNPDHAYHACLAALRCQEAVARLNKSWEAEGKPRFVTRIGLHTGETLVGNMGSSERMNYTVLGDSVNLASRLEAINKIYGTAIIVSLSTYHRVVEHFHFRPLDIVTVKGKEQGVLLYELAGQVGHTPPETVSLCEQFTAGFDAYLIKDWQTAINVFEELHARYPTDLASEIYYNRCLALQQAPPDPDWVPVVNLSSK